MTTRHMEVAQAAPAGDARPDRGQTIARSRLHANDTGATNPCMKP